MMFNKLFRDEMYVKNAGKLFIFLKNTITKCNKLRDKYQELM